MLLNQCLAISLSASKSRNIELGQRRDKNSGSKSNEFEELEESSARNVFKNFVTTNSNLSNQQPEVIGEKKGEDEKRWRELEEAINRVEFAGYVVPSWLLLSGAFGDLHCIKTNWSEGRLGSPVGFKIETIGNIRSVNVDYFGVTNIDHIKQVESDGVEQANLEEGSNREAQVEAEAESLSGQQTKLGSTIVELIGELDRKGGVHISNLIEHLNVKHAQLGDSPVPVWRVDRSISCLVKSNQLKLSPMTRQQAIEWRKRLPQLDSVFLEQLISSTSKISCEEFEGHFLRRESRVSSASTNKSKSTTLDSGIHSWDLMSSQMGEPTMHELAAQVVVGQAPTRRAFSYSRSFSMRPKQAHRTQIELADDRWSRRKQADEEEQLRSNNRANLSNLFRSKSMRIISSGKSSRQIDESKLESDLSRRRAATSDYSEQLRSGNRPATIDYLATARAHKRGFSIRRNSLLTFNATSDSSGAKIVLFLRKLFSIKRARDVSSERIIEGRSSGTRLCMNQQSAFKQPQQTSERSQPRIVPAANLSASTSPTSSSSSGSNSLIEILDCSPAVNNSRRLLREEPASRTRLSRATWRILERSNSNLSEQSAASCSTTKSTVSQQLRRHLDEAYKRHRNCTSQREKEFIDSINVLRQASRHALQNSRPSSKTRQVRSAGSKSETDSLSLIEADRLPLEVNNDIKSGSNDNNNIIEQRMSQIDLTKLPSCHQQPTVDNLACCCLCPSYLASARLCPLACCSAPASPLACCIGRPKQAELEGELAESASACCPIWRSMVCSYYQLPFYPVPHPASLGSQLQLQLQPNQQLGEQLSGRLENFSTSHQHQHQQHNTTIDLKIEIGDFKQSGSRRLLVEQEDSLDSDQTEQTDESAAALDESLEPDSPPDSLRAINQVVAIATE